MSCEKRDEFSTDRENRNTLNCAEGEMTYAQEGEIRSARVPNGNTLFDYQGCSECNRLLQTSFKAKILMCLSEPSGKVGHAEIKIGDSRIMLADEYPEMGSRGPQSLGGSPVSILLYMDDCDEIFDRAIAKGAKVVKPLSDQFYGDRAGTLEDPFGHIWTIATHKEDLTSEEIFQRAAARPS